MHGSILLSMASEVWVAITGSLTLAVFSAIFAALGYGVHEIRKLRNRVHELHVEHQALRRDVEEELAISDLGAEPGLDPGEEEPRIEDRRDPTSGTTDDPSSKHERGGR